jgi:hypothetical protein
VWSYSNTVGNATQKVLDLSPTTYFSVYSGVNPIPANFEIYEAALMQQTVGTTSSSSKVEVQWDVGMFNGMLFKDFVQNGAYVEYIRYTLQTATGSNPDPRLTYASFFQLSVQSASAGSFSNFVFEPYLNADSQGPMVYQQWVTNSMNQTTGTNGSWPWASVTSYGE